MKVILYILIFTNIFVNSLFCQSNNASAFLNNVTTLSLHGKLNEVSGILKNSNDSQLTEAEMAFKMKFQQRFIEQNDSFDFNTENQEIIDFVKIFQSYWRDVMMNEVDIEIADSKFLESIVNHMYNQYFSLKGISQPEIQSNIYKFGNEYLQSQGFYSNAFGKTGHLYDLFLWRDNSIKVYDIELIDEKVEVTVHLLNDFISKGWSHYATFGEKYASGWANREALFCIVSAYDLNSEQFRVSYLVHEGQHFRDYSSYPELLQRDLEYRAKLTEIIKSNNTTFHIIHKFLSNSSNEINNAHAFANYCVIRDLNKELLVGKTKIEIKNWGEINPDLIKQKAKFLYEKHSKQLESIGSKNVKELIR